MFITRKISTKKLEAFLEEVYEKSFLSIKKNRLLTKKYSYKKKFTHLFVSKNNKYIACALILNTSYSNHLYFLYVLKEFRKKRIGRMLLREFFEISKEKIKTVHVKNTLKKVIKFYLKNSFKRKIDYQNKSLLKWKQRCMKRNKYHFNTRVLLFKTNVKSYIG